MEQNSLTVTNILNSHNSYVFLCRRRRTKTKTLALGCLKLKVAATAQGFASLAANHHMFESFKTVVCSRNDAAQRQQQRNSKAMAMYAATAEACCLKVNNYLSACVCVCE